MNDKNTPPTQDEIVTRITEIQKMDVFGFGTGDLLSYLDFEHAKPFLKPETKKEEWEPELPKKLDRAELKKEMEKYMDFAWEKAKNCRGLSASRSLMHYAAWCWLMGDIELSNICLGDYEFYGKDHLVKICTHYGWDPERWDDHRRVNREDEDD